MWSSVSIGVIYGAVVARIDGKGLIPKFLSRLLCILPFMLGCYFAGWYCLFALLGFVGIATGHGQYFLSMERKALGPEFFDRVAQLFFGEDPRADKSFLQYRDDNWKDAPNSVKSSLESAIKRYGHKKLYWRSVFGMFVTGSLVGLPACILALIFNLSLTIIIGFLLTGVIKALSYMISHRIFNATEPAECLNGTLRTLVALLPLIL